MDGGTLSKKITKWEHKGQKEVYSKIQFDGWVFKEG
jgi:hypothetical protein